MASLVNLTKEQEDKEFNQAFGRHTGISKGTRTLIDVIKNNGIISKLGENKFCLCPSNAERFADQAWQLLGKYIANNTHLDDVDLDGCSLTDQKMYALFSGLVKSSLSELDIRDNLFGIEGVRSMVRFLQNSPNLTYIYIMENNKFNSECFEVLVQALQNTRVRRLELDQCSITDISVLEAYNNLPNLHTLNLNCNKIGRGGCVSLASLLQEGNTRLEWLNLYNTDIDDKGAEVLATSLKHNTTVETLNLRGNSNITKVGHRAFLELLNNMSSIENTYNSNHKLTEINLVDTGRKSDLIRCIDSVIRINKKNPTSRAAGRAKIIKYQLNSQERSDQCQLQGIEYSSSIGNLLADIDPILLPDIIALIGEEHGHNELYSSLIPMVSDLMSCVNTSHGVQLSGKKRYRNNELTRWLGH